MRSLETAIELREDGHPFGDDSEVYQQICRYIDRIVPPSAIRESNAVDVSFSALISNFPLFW
jgi:hypothetical protein